MKTGESASGGILLSTVDDALVIKGLGLVIFPGLPNASAIIPILRRGSPITLRRPDGSELQTSIGEVEMISRRPPVPFTAIRLPSNVAKRDVPIGTEIWYFPNAHDTFVGERSV